MSSGQDYFADALQADATLTGMLKKVILSGPKMTIDLLAYHIRMYGRWVQKKQILHSGHVRNRRQDSLTY